MNVLLIAGEKSGEEHALSFLPTILSLAPHVSFWGVGGDELQKTGMELTYHLKDFSSWGIGEVIGKIPFYLKAEKNILREVERRGTKTAILIDFQDFNLRLAKKLKKRGVKVLYYVAPQAWAWKAWRAKVLSQTVHTLFTIIPFEKKWFLDRGVNQVRGVIHPLLHHYKNDLKNLPDRTFSSMQKECHLLILPGSRNFEVKNLLPIFLETAVLLKQEFNIKLSLVRTTSVKSEIYDYYAHYFDRVYNSEDLTQALKEADLCLAASGTVTLASALFEVPTVVSYMGNLVTEFIFNNFISYKGPISLTNIVHEKILFPEILQYDVNAANLRRQLLPWLTNVTSYEKIKAELKETKNKISGEDFDLPRYLLNVIDGKN
ncbi:MAG: lipid-A-disaccharide synthase [Bacteriovoracaceae bacterium]